MFFLSAPSDIYGADVQATRITVFTVRQATQTRLHEQAENGDVYRNAPSRQKSLSRAQGVALFDPSASQSGQTSLPWTDAVSSNAASLLTFRVTYFDMDYYTLAMYSAVCCPHLIMSYMLAWVSCTTNCHGDSGKVPPTTTFAVSPLSSRATLGFVLGE